MNLSKENLNIGAWSTIGHPEVVEAMLSTKVFNWLAVDYEHSTPTISDMASIFSLCEKYDVISFVRILGHDHFFARKMLDIGAKGIIVPVIESREEIDNFSKHLFYPPKGKRGFCLSRVNKWGDGFDTYLNDFRPIIIPQIESKKGADNIEDIVTHENVDGVFIGPYDLSGSLGTPGNFTSKEMNEYLSNINKKVLKYKKFLGLHVVEPCVKQLQEKADEGFNFIALGTDIVCMRSSLQKVYQSLK